MPCDTSLKQNQTLSERAVEVRKAVGLIQSRIIDGRAKVKVGPQGAVAFEGIEDIRDGITDACTYRRIMVSGSALARAAITRAEQLAGRSVDRKIIGQGHHSHDGGKTWHDHKG